MERNGKTEKKITGIWESSVGKVTIFTFLMGVIVHFFCLVNTMHNYDSIHCQVGYGTGVKSGRWALTVIGNLVGKIWGGENYNLTYVNGILFLMFLGASAGVLFCIFRFKSWKTGALMGTLFVVFPTAVSTLFFRYTAVYYGFAILLSVIAVWVIDQLRFGVVIAAVCIAVSTGIYQAYVPLTISLFLVVMMKKVLEEEITWKSFFGRGIRYCSSILMGMALYFAALKASLVYYGEELESYQGISEIGQIQISQIPELLRRMWEGWKVPLENGYSISPTTLLKTGYAILGVLSLIVIVQKLTAKKKNIKQMVMFLILAILFPIAVNFIVFMCPNSKIYTLMVYSFFVVLLLPIVLFDNLEKKSFLRKSIVVVLVVMACNYAYVANVNYSMMYYATQITENYLNAMVTQVRMTKGYEPSKKWLFIGKNIEDPLLYNPWWNSLSYGGQVPYYVNNYSRMDWIKNYFGYKIPMENREDVMKRMEESKEVKEMPCWPSEGSIKVIDDSVVIKLQEED